MGGDDDDEAVAADDEPDVWEETVDLFRLRGWYYEHKPIARP